MIPDTYKAVKALEKAGASTELAEAMVNIGYPANGVATKDDIKNMATKDDIKDIEHRMATKDDIKDIEHRMATKDDIKNMATRDDIKDIEHRMATKDDIKNMATKDDIKNMATKDDIKNLIERFEERFKSIDARFKLHLALIGICITISIAALGGIIAVLVLMVQLVAKL